MAESLLTTPMTYEKRGRIWGGTPVTETLLQEMDLPNVDRGVRELGNCFNAQRDLRTGLLTVSMESRHPQLAQQVVRLAVERLEEFTKHRAQSRGGAKAQFTRSRLRDAEQAYDEAATAFGIFLEKNRGFQTSADPSVRLQGMKLEGQLMLRKQLVMTAALSLEQALVEEKDDTPILNVLDPGHLPIDKNGPHRGSASIIAFFVAGLGFLGYRRRAWLQRQLDPQNRGN
jgi:hypothetical protein